MTAVLLCELARPRFSQERVDELFNHVRLGSPTNALELFGRRYLAIEPLRTANALNLHSRTRVGQPHRHRSILSTLQGTWIASAMMVARPVLDGPQGRPAPWP